MKRSMFFGVLLLIMSITSVVAMPLVRRNRSACGVVQPAPSSTRIADDLAASRPQELQRIYEMRLYVAREHYELSTDIYRVGGTTVDDVLRSEARLAMAEFEAALTPQSRIEALERSVRNAKISLDVVKMQHEIGRVSTLDVRDVEYSLMTAEIRLAEEQRKFASAQGH